MKMTTYLKDIPYVAHPCWALAYLDQLIRSSLLLYIFRPVMKYIFSVTSKKLPNIYNSCPKMISLEKWKILTTLQKLPIDMGDLGKTIITAGFEKLPKVQ